MTQEEFNAMMNHWLRAREEAEPSSYSEEARAWAEASGLIKGDLEGNKQYKSFCTREQMMVFLHRLHRMSEV